MSSSEETTAALGLGHVAWQDYVALCKPKVVLLMLITSVVGMLLAFDGSVAWQVFIYANLGIGLSAASAAAINHIVDQEIDKRMARTHRRPLPQGHLSTAQAIRFSISLFVLSMFILITWVNTLTALLTFLSLLAYAFVYTLFLKRATPQNIVIGGVAGAAPPLLGWTAVTGEINSEALLLMLIIFVWTPSHFWALAIHRKDEYAKVNIPMLPVTHGIAFTKLSITLYSLLLLAVSLLPYTIAMSGIPYLVCATILGVLYCYYAINLQFYAKPLSAIKLFKYSCWYLLLLFLALLLDHYLLLII